MRHSAIGHATASSGELFPRHDQFRRAPGTKPTVLNPLPSVSNFDRFDERSLVEAARQDPNAFAALYRRYVERIHGYAFRRSNSRAIAEDVTSATFEKALRGLSSYRWREPGIGPWLFRIASNELVDVYRRSDRQDRIAARVQTSQPRFTSDDMGAVDTGEEVRAALADISPRYQRALTLRFFAELSNEEAAAAMGVSRRTMAVVVHRASAALRRSLEARRAEEVHDG